MAFDYDLVTTTGVVVPDTQDLRAQVIAEYLAAFGADLSTDSSTPQGVLINMEALARTAVVINNAALANQINPNLAGGIFLDAILKLTGSSRTSASHTLVTCVLTGVNGTIIPLASQAKDTNGVLYQSVGIAAATILLNTATVVFEAVDTGAITCGANTLTSIVSDILGWETINNPAVQDSVGSAEQSDAEARLFRRRTLALQGLSIAEAIVSGLYATTGVTSVFFQENVAATPQVINGVSMVAHSLYACVLGGSDIAVANILQLKKSGGCAYNNGASGTPISVPLIVQVSGQVIDVLFDRPDDIPFIVLITISATTAVNNPSLTTKDAIAAYINGLQVGTGVSPFELAGAVVEVAPGIFVHDLQVSKASPVSFVRTEITLAVFEKASATAGSVTVTLV